MSDDGTISQVELAKVLGVTRQMVGKYARLGMPTAGRGRFDRDAAVAWVQAEISDHGHGGKGRGGGRPAGKPGRTPKPKPPAEAEGYRKANTRRIEAQTQLAELEISKIAGKLLDRESTLTAIRGHLVVVRQTIERQGAAIAKAIAAEFGLDTDKAARAKAIVREGHAKAFSRIAANPMEL